MAVWPMVPETVSEIPVVIHVMHTGGLEGSQYNPADAQLTGMIDYLNQSFQATWAAYSAPGSGGTRVPFRFVLAQRASGLYAHYGHRTCERQQRSGLCQFWRTCSIHHRRF